MADETNNEQQHPDGEEEVINFKDIHGKIDTASMFSGSSDVASMLAFATAQSELAAGLASGEAEETDIARDDLTGTALEEGWEFLREEPSAWRLAGLPSRTARGGLEISTLPGGFWGEFGNENPAKNSLLRGVPANEEGATLACQVTVLNNAKSRGEQAGLIWYFDDNNYVKLVTEGGRDGSTSVVLAVEVDGVPRVVSKTPVADPSTPVTLRLEVNRTAAVGAVDWGYLLQVVDTCEPPFVPSSSSSSSSSQPGAAQAEDAWASAKVGLIAHGGEALEGSGEYQKASFTSFSLVRVAAGRAPLATRGI